MSTCFYGATAAQNPDNSGETLMIDGFVDQLRAVKDEHDDSSSWRLVGAIKKSKKIYSLKECEDDKQRRVWNYAQVPLVYVEGELADDTDHPNAKAAAELLKFANRPDIPLDIGLSVDGGIIERLDTNGQPTEDKATGKTLSKTLGLAAALTVKPCNPKCKLFLENDLTKSDLAAEPSVRCIAALRKSRAKTSFIESFGPGITLLVKLDSLKKSLSDYFGAFTDIKCHKCGHPMRFFKASQELPNGCVECGSQFSLSDIWGALNK
jgi:ribosomal protein S27E